MLWVPPDILKEVIHVQEKTCVFPLTDSIKVLSRVSIEHLIVIKTDTLIAKIPNMTAKQLCI